MAYAVVFAFLNLPIPITCQQQGVHSGGPGP